MILCFFLDKIKFFIPFPYFYLLINPSKDPYPLQHQSLQPSSSWRRQLTWPWVWRFCSLWTQSGVWLFYLQTWIKINSFCVGSLNRGGWGLFHFINFHHIYEKRKSFWGQQRFLSSSSGQKSPGWAGLHNGVGRCKQIQNISLMCWFLNVIYSSLIWMQIV